MARPITWLPRLHALQRSVNDSVRSHYSREDIERLFEIQPRSAQLLMGLLPTAKVGLNLLVERGALAALLDRLACAEDAAAEFAAIRAAGKPQVVKRKLRELVQRDMDAELSAPPAGVELDQGLFQVRFKTVEELASCLQWIALVLNDDLDGFADRYEVAVEQDAREVAEREAERADAEYIRAFLAKAG